MYANELPDHVADEIIFNPYFQSYPIILMWTIIIVHLEYNSLLLAL